MGWGSATSLFDGSVGVTVEFLKAATGQIHLPSAMLAAVVEKTYRDIDWADWDTQSESKYFKFLIPIMEADGHLDPGYYEWYTSGRPDNFAWPEC